MEKKTDRRRFLTKAALAAAATPALLTRAEAQSSGSFSRYGEPYKIDSPPMRVILNGDFSGDPDGLFALVHQLLQPGWEVRSVQGAHLGNEATQAARNRARRANAGGPGGVGAPPTDNLVSAATDAHKIALEVLDAMDLKNISAHQGSNAPLKDRKTPQESDAAKAIVAEAMRTDDPRPLYVTTNGTITDVASAYLMEPKIAGRFTMVSILGGPYPGGGTEYNASNDILATQVIFNDSTIPLWQFPSSIYRTSMFSYAEFQVDIKPYGKIGPWLWNRFASGRARGAARSMGDSPLGFVTLGSNSCVYEEQFAPHVNDDLTYTERNDGRKIRVYTSMDNRLMFSDFKAQMKLHYGQG